MASIKGHRFDNYACVGPNNHLSNKHQSLRRVVLARCYELILAHDWGVKECACAIPNENGVAANAGKQTQEEVEADDGADD